MGAGLCPHKHMTKEQISALRWAIDLLPDSGHLVVLRALKAQGERALNDRLIPLQDDHCKVPQELLLFMAKHHITIPNSELSTWRWLKAEDQVYGEVNGIPESRGIVRYTNGILCYIEQVGHGMPFLGHYEFFIPDPVVKINHDGTPKKERHSDRVLNLYS